MYCLCITAMSAVSKIVHLLFIYCPIKYFSSIRTQPSPQICFMNYFLCLEVKKNNLLCLPVLKIHPVYIAILQDEGYNKSNQNIIFGGSVTTVSVHCIKMHGDNRGMASDIFELSTRHR